MSEPRDQWKRVLRPLGDCVAIERFGEILTPEERQHIASCARCHAEMELWKSFDDDATTPREAADVRWIVGEMAHRRAGGLAVVPMSSRKSGMPRMLAAASVIFVILGIAYLLNNRQPSINVPSGQYMAYRSLGIKVIAPSGDVAAAPARLEWIGIPGAASYDVRVVEVDRAILWRVSTGETRVDVPPAIRAQFVPGKSILWEVTARREATVLAESGTQKFRVAVQ
ncbi:MAG TPA: hypothetical protein VF713_10230, partial [Thermoanaerobaculia bacterium]